MTYPWRECPACGMLMWWCKDKKTVEWRCTHCPYRQTAPNDSPCPNVSAIEALMSDRQPGDMPTPIEFREASDADHPIMVWGISSTALRRGDYRRADRAQACSFGIWHFGQSITAY